MRNRYVPFALALLSAGWNNVTADDTKTPAPDEANRLIALTDSLAPLQERFNAAREKLQLVAILSPT